MVLLLAKKPPSVEYGDHEYDCLDHCSGPLQSPEFNSECMHGERTRNPSSSRLHLPMKLGPARGDVCLTSRPRDLDIIIHVRDKRLSKLPICSTQANLRAKPCHRIISGQSEASKIRVVCIILPISLRPLNSDEAGYSFLLPRHQEEPLEQM
jgi:hypothetical protein